MTAPLLRPLQWLWRGPAPLPAAVWVVATRAQVQAADKFLTALSRRGPMALALLDGGPYTGRWPWLSWPPVGGARMARRLQAKAWVMLDDGGRAQALAAQAHGPVIWVNGRSPVLATLGRVTVGSDAQRRRVGTAELTGDPLIDLPTLAPHDATFCARFAPVRDAGRWVFYGAQTTAGEEDIVYRAFLQLAVTHAGLLALAPADPARHEGIYRESIRYHLLTTRQRRLLTSTVPPRTRVYYIEDQAALRAMYGCADVTLVGGTFAGGAVDIAAAVQGGRALLVGPRREHPLVQAVVDAGIAVPCDNERQLIEQARMLLTDSAARQRQEAAIRQWWLLQQGARERVLALLP
ncbi:MAG: hypothetical protein ACYCXG_03025 [Acidiferrobacter sp.]